MREKKTITEEIPTVDTAQESAVKSEKPAVQEEKPKPKRPRGIATERRIFGRRVFRRFLTIFYDGHPGGGLAQILRIFCGAGGVVLVILAKYKAELQPKWAKNAVFG